MAVCRGTMGRMTPADWTLVAIAAGKEKGLSPVQLQKILFLLGIEKRAELGDFYRFSAYNYGPFCKQIYEDAEILAEQGLVAITPATGRQFSVFIATAEGAERVDALRADAPPRAVKYLDSVVQWARSLTFGQLVRA